MLSSMRFITRIHRLFQKELYDGIPNVAVCESYKNDYT
jgi:hypothetical protein